MREIMAEELPARAEEDLRNKNESGKSLARIDSRELLKGARRLIITHQGAEYILQVTKSSRLILTK